MGVLNVTPDSFFDGGRYYHLDQAVLRGKELLAEGADLVDVGGESSRPGAEEVPESVEAERVLPVIEALAPLGPVSIDTTKASVARAGVAAGAVVINDVSGSLWPLAAELQVGWVAMHRRGTSATMATLASYADVVAEVRHHLLELAARAKEAGVPQIWMDPGIGFAKTTRHNLELLAHLGELVEAATESGHQVLVGTSRKSFLGQVAAPGPHRLAVEDRLEGSLATAVLAAVAGAAMIRVHDVAETVRALDLVGPHPPERPRPGTSQVDLAAVPNAAGAWQ